MMDNAVIERVAVFMLERCVVIAIGCTVGRKSGKRERLYFNCNLNFSTSTISSAPLPPFPLHSLQAVVALSPHFNTHFTMNPE